MEAIKWVFEYVSTVWKHYSCTPAFTLCFRALCKNMFFDAVPSVSWEEFFEVIWSSLVIGVGREGSPQGAIHSPAGSHCLHQWQTEMLQNRANCSTGDRLTSITVRKKFEIRRMGERVLSITWCVISMCLIYSFSFLLPNFFNRWQATAKSCIISIPRHYAFFFPLYFLAC